MARLHLTILSLLIAIFCLEWHQTEAAKCQDGWIQYEQSCYLFDTSSKTWFEHKQHCVDLGGHLVAINNKAEETFLESEMRRRHLVGRSEDFCAWSDHEPNNVYGHEHCLELNFGILWNDNECTLSQGAICEATPLPQYHWISFGNSSF